MNDITGGDPSTPPAQPTTGATSNTLYVYWNDWAGGYHLVSQATIERANAESDAAEVGDDEDSEAVDEVDDEIPVENVFMHVIQTSMDQDVPDDLLEEFCAFSAPMFVDYTVTYITSERLEPLIAALEGRGYSIVRDH